MSFDEILDLTALEEWWRVPGTIFLYTINILICYGGRGAPKCYEGPQLKSSIPYPQNWLLRKRKCNPMNHNKKNLPGILLYYHLPGISKNGLM